MGNVIQDCIGNIRTVRAFANEKHEAEKFREQNDKKYEIGKKLAMVSAGWEFNQQFFMNSNFAGLLYYSSFLIERGEMTIGDIMSIMLYMVLVVSKFGEISWLIGEVFKVKGATEKILTLMQDIPEVNATGGKIIPEDKIVGEIEFKNVTFCYPTKKDVTVSNNMCIHVKNHQTIAFTGHSGSGKSSMISLIERFYDPQEGSIHFSGVDIKELEPRWYKQQIALVAQEPVLFAGSIKENICYGLDVEKVRQEDLETACKQAMCYNFITDGSLFPEGFDTLVGEKGIKLSGG